MFAGGMIDEEEAWKLEQEIDDELGSDGEEFESLSP